MIVDHFQKEFALSRLKILSAAYIMWLLGHCNTTSHTDSYLSLLYKRPGHRIPCGDTVTKYLYNTRVHVRLDFKMEVNTMSPDQTAPLGAV